MGRSRAAVEPETTGFFVATAQDEQSAQEVYGIMQKVAVAHGCTNFTWITEISAIPDLIARLQNWKDHYAEDGDAKGN